jgi:arabinan endo-1,5-alpha-L-arabinosidase
MFSIDLWSCWSSSSNIEQIFGDTDGWGTVHIHDPSVVKHDGWYYSFGTHLRVTIARSPTLYGPWKHLGSVLDAGQSIIELPGRDDIWVS